MEPWKIWQKIFPPCMIFVLYYFQITTFDDSFKVWRVNLTVNYFLFKFLWLGCDLWFLIYFWYVTYDMLVFSLLKVDRCCKMRPNLLLFALLLMAALSSGKSRKRILQPKPDYLSTYNSFELSFVDLKISRMVFLVLR